MKPSTEFLPVAVGSVSLVFPLRLRIPLSQEHFIWYVNHFENCCQVYKILKYLFRNHPSYMLFFNYATLHNLI